MEARGVRFSTSRSGGGGSHERDGEALLRPGGEVLLAAGAVGSPHLLQVSGIGPAALLHQHGVRPLLDLPGVGSNLHDHLQIRAVFRLKDGTHTLNALANSMLGRVKMGSCVRGCVCVRACV